MTLRSSRADHAPAALFGKLPCALDFVRINHDSAESIALDRWLQAGLQRLTARHRRWPPGQVTFVFAIDAEHALVGVAADSCDRAGRRFPLAVYARVARPPQVARGTAALVLASEPFVTAARALLARRAELGSAEVSLHLRRLRPPRAHDVQVAADQLSSELEARSLGAFAAPLFAAAISPERCGLAALEQLRALRSSSGHAVEVFDCPVRSARDVATWAYWLERAHGRPSAAMWDLPGRERALLSSGPLPERAPLFWTLPSVPHPRLSRIDEGVALAPAPGDTGQSLAAVFERVARQSAPAS